MVTKSKTTNAGQGDAKVAAAAIVANTEEQPVERDELIVKTGTFSFSDGSKYSA